MSFSRLRTFIFLTALLLVRANAEYDPKTVEARELFNQGLTHFFARNYETSIEKFNKSLQIRSKDNLVRYYLGLAYSMAGYTPNALAEWENIIKLGGQDSFLAQKMSAMYYLRGRKETVPLLEDYVYLKTLPDVAHTNLSPLSYPTGLWASGKEQVFFVDHKKNSFGWLHPNGDQTHFLIDGLITKVPGMDRLTAPYELLPTGDNLGESFYISDFGADRVALVDRLGAFKNVFGKKGVGDGEFLGPSGLAPGPAGQVFVSDTGNCRIQVFNDRGEFLFTFGKRGGGPGELMLPSGLASDMKKGRLFVADRGNNRISVFDFSGNFVESFGDGFLLKPRKILADRLNQNILVILDSKNVYLYDRIKDAYRSIFYTVNDTGLREVEPVAGAFDRSGLLYVGDALSGNVEIFSPVKLLYVNLQVQIDNVYLRDFPKVMATVSIRTKDGDPVVGLTRLNFELRENNVPKSFKLNQIPETYNDLRLTLLVEKSRAAEDRSLILKSLLEDLFAVLGTSEQTQIMDFGGGNEEGRGTYREVLPYNNSVLKNIDAVMKGKYYDRFFAGTVLKRAIGGNLNNYYKRGILLVAFSDYPRGRFAPEEFDVLCDFARNNGIPVSVLYAGPNMKAAKGSKETPLKLLAELSRRTGGTFVVYENKSSLDSLVKHFRNYQSGIYTLHYDSFVNEMKSGQFRSLEVRTSYKGMTGLDNRGGYPVPLPKN